MWSDWAALALCAAAIALAGSRLSRLADALAAKTGLSRSWIGVLLLATITSLPELATGVSAIRIASAPDIAVGDALGSTVFNLSLLVLLDILQRKESIYGSASSGHVLSAGFGVMLLSMVGAAILLHTQQALPRVWHVGAYTLFVAALYIVAMKSIFAYERRQLRELDPEHRIRLAGDGLWKLALQFLLAAAVVVAAGIWLPIAGHGIAEHHGLSETFVGTLLIAASTSLPELVVTIAAWRLGALDMAIGGLLGSNLFDLLIIAIDDLLYLPGPILAHVSPMHAVTAFSAAMMSGAMIVGLTYRPRLKLLRLMSLVSAFLAAVYLANLAALFAQGR